MTDRKDIYSKALDLNALTIREGVMLYTQSPLDELMFVADKIRGIHNPVKNVGWMIDRNVNITNVCFSQCTFCNFCRKQGADDA